MALTLRIILPAKRPHKSLSRIDTLRRSGIVMFTGLMGERHNGVCVIAATSRAIPITDKQSALFGVNFTTKICPSK